MTMTATTDISLGICCPMANEGDDAVRFVQEVLRRCTGFRVVAFFAVLDGATTDNTRELLDALAATEPRLKVVWAPENRCVVDAYIRGYREALASGSDWILEIDAGFSHDPDDLPKFFAAKSEGCDCVFGSRFLPESRRSNVGPKRYVVSRGGTLLTNLLIGTRQTDMTSGFQLFSRPAMEMILQRGIRSRAHFFQTEMKVFCRNLRWVEVPIRYSSPSPRLKGSAVAESLRQVWQLRKLVRSGAV